MNTLWVKARIRLQPWGLGRHRDGISRVWHPSFAKQDALSVRILWMYYYLTIVFACAQKTLSWLFPLHLLFAVPCLNHQNNPKQKKDISLCLRTCPSDIDLFLDPFLLLDYLIYKLNGSEQHWSSPMPKSPKQTEQGNKSMSEGQVLRHRRVCTFFVFWWFRHGSKPDSRHQMQREPMFQAQSAASLIIRQTCE